MPKFAANISLLFDELPYLERFAAAAAVGFKAVEILFPYSVSAQETKDALDRNNLTLVLINAPPPESSDGLPGYAAVPGGEARFEQDFQRVMNYVDVLQPRLVHIMSGKARGERAEATFVRNLQWAADHAPTQRFCIEPLNPDDQPGYFLNNYPLAARVLAAVNRPNVGLQYDSYHAQKIHGDPLGIWEKFRADVVHVQVGDTPDRRTPMTGEIDFPRLFAALDQSGYHGWISGEYHPRGPTSPTLDWMR